MAALMDFIIWQSTW